MRLFCCYKTRADSPGPTPSQPRSRDDTANLLENEETAPGASSEGDVSHTETSRLLTPATTHTPPPKAPSIEGLAFLIKGGFSEILKGVMTTTTNEKKSIAKKIPLSNNPIAPQIIRQEAKILFYIRDIGGNLHVQDILWFEDGDSPALIMPYYKGGDLLDHIAKHKTVPPQSFIQLTLALIYLHNIARVIHLDLKPDNVFLDKDDKVILGDFGFAEQLDPDKETRNDVGSLAYAAPEVWGDSLVSTATDIFSLAKLFWVMRALRTDFFLNKDRKNTGTDSQLRCQLGEPPKLSVKGIENTFYETLLPRMWQPMPEKRLAAQQVHDEIAKNQIMSCS